MPNKQGLRSAGHCLGALTLAAGLTLGHGVAQADVAKPDALRQQPIETITRDMHPAGPTVRHEWRHSANATPFRLEIEGARSGALLVGQVRLRLSPDGRWALAVTTPAGEITQTVDLSPPHPARIKAAGHRWKVEVLKENKVTPQPGIATEAEPSLDLRLTR